MLQKLIIRNYAIIDDIIFEPDSHLNVMTGETGAGKSIIMGALSLILGARADASLLAGNGKKCIVEGWFSVGQNTEFREALLRENLDEEDICVIRREITSNGKSRAFVNDTPVTLSTLSDLTSQLVDLHRQMSFLALNQNDFQMDILDALAQNNALTLEYNQLFRSYRDVCSRLEEQQQRQRQEDADYKTFLLEEIKTGAWQAGELEEIEQELRKLEHADQIIQTLEEASVKFSGEGVPVIPEIRRVSQQLSEITNFLPEAGELETRLHSVYEELKDIQTEIEKLGQKIHSDPEKKTQLEERFDAGNRLLRKHHVKSTTDLIKIMDELEHELEVHQRERYQIEELTQKKAEIYGELVTYAEKLSLRRKQQIPEIEQQVNSLLNRVGMPNARFQIQLTAEPEIGSLGLDRVSFLLDANNSGQFLPLYKTASGGEMSRIMLCIKSLIANVLQLPTLIFDEVDAGISGEAARQVGLLLAVLGKNHQVICITHQPQVAARGTTHFLVYKKEQEDGSVRTRLQEISEEDRVMAVAGMIGGKTPGEAEIQSAREWLLPTKKNSPTQ